MCSDRSPRTFDAARPYNPKMATSVMLDDTQALLDAWQAGVPIEVLVQQFCLTPQAIRCRAAWHKVKRPAWFLSAIRGRTQQRPS
jgi:hypothetical protein